MFSNSNYRPHSKDGEGNVLHMCVCSQIGGQGVPSAPRQGQGVPLPPSQHRNTHHTATFPRTGTISCPASQTGDTLLARTGVSPWPGHATECSYALGGKPLAVMQEDLLVTNIFVCKLIMKNQYLVILVFINDARK